MRQMWLKRLTALALAMLICVLPALADVQETPVVVSDTVDELVPEEGLLSFGEEESLEETGKKPAEATGEPQETADADGSGRAESDGEDPEPTEGVDPEPTEGVDPEQNAGTPSVEEFDPEAGGSDSGDGAADPEQEGSEGGLDEAGGAVEGEPDGNIEPEDGSADADPDETADVNPDGADGGADDPAESTEDGAKAAEDGAEDGDADAAAEAAEGAADDTPTPEPTGAPELAEAQASPTATPAPEAETAEETVAPKLEEAAAEEAPVEVLPSEVFLGKGEKRLLTPVIAADGPVDIVWTSSKPKTVAVSKKGKLSAKRRGSAIVTMTASNGVTASCLVRVFKAPSKVTMVPGKKLSMGLGEVYQLSGKLPSGAYSNLSWSSTAPGVASVDAEGRVTALSPGTAKIKVKTFNGKKAVCKVSVKAAPSAVAFSVGDQTIGVGMTVDLKPIVNPGAAANIAVSSSDPGVAAVIGGKVTGVNPGTAVITGSTYNGLSTALTVTVLPAPNAVGLAYGTLYIGLGERIKLEPATDPGTATSYKFKSGNKKIAAVSAAGMVRGKKKGTTTVTVTTHNGLKTKVKIKVLKAPSKVTLKPSSLAMETGNTYQLQVSLPKKTASTVTFTSSNPDIVSVDNMGLLYAAQPGVATITATTFNNKKATCQVTVGTFSGDAAVASSGSVSLSTTGMVMMSLGASWNLTASSETSNMEGMSWTTTSTSIAKIKYDGAACTVTAAGAGTAIVTAKLTDGSYASVIFMMVDVNDLSAANFNAVQKALLNHDGLIDSAAGGNVIWDMISARMLKAGYKQEQVNDLIARLKAADPTYRDLYIYSFGTYNQAAEQVIGQSQFDQSANKLYLRKSSTYAESGQYAYVVFHESGHAIDWNADANQALNSLNADATSAVLSDVRSLLTDRVATAIVDTHVNASSVNTGKVVDMLMNYKVLTDASLLDGLNESERAVYNWLSGIMNTDDGLSKLPQNNGCMVWDAVEGATNYAVHGDFGHYYLLSNPNYKAEATYYFWNLKGEPQITTEPFAEFFSANVMGDSSTLSLNWKYLPQTCKYFAESLIPQMLSYFTNRIKSA